MEREVFANGKSFVISLEEDGSLIGRYCMLLDAVFTELFELKLFPYDVQDLAMDIQYHSYPQVSERDVKYYSPEGRCPEECIFCLSVCPPNPSSGLAVWTYMFMYVFRWTYGRMDKISPAFKRTCFP